MRKDQDKTKDKTKAQPAAELTELRRQVSALEAAAAQSAQIEEALRENEARYRQLFATVPDAIVFFDAETRRCLDANDAAVRLYGYSREELLRLRNADLTAEPEASSKAMARVLVDQTLQIPTRLQRKKDGTVFPVEISASAFNLGGREIVCSVARDITERRKIEEALRDSEERFRELFDNLASGVAVYEAVDDGADFVFKNWNRAGSRMDGVSQEEVVGRKVTEVFPSVESFGLLDVFRRVWRTGKTERHPISQYQDDKLEGWRDNTVYKLPAGEIVAVYTDETERKQGEEELRRYEHIVSSSSDMLALLNKKYTYLAANGAYLKAFNKTREELIGRQVSDVFGEEFFEKTIKPNADRCLAGEEVNYQDWFDFPLGGRRCMDITYFPYIDASGEVQGFVVNGRDITAQEQAEKALRESEERFRSLFETMAQGVVYQEAEGRIVLVNPAAERILGLTLDQLQGRTSMNPRWRAIHEDGADFPGETHPAIVALKTRKEVRDVVMGVFNPTTADYTWININAIPQRGSGDDAPNQVYTTFEDITERKRAEEERKNLEVQVQHSQKLESLGVLAGGIAHDFNNLLMGILGNADLALEDLSPVSPVRPSIMEIEKAARRAADLTKQMLAYSGRGSFIIKAIDLSELVEEMAYLLESSISRKVKLQVHLERSLPAVEADVAQMQQIVMNLITNAAEAIGEDNVGAVTIETGVKEYASEYLQQSRLPEERPAGKYVFLEVRDTGCGMDAETREKLFDPFFTTKFTGRGLGLSAVLGIVRGHQGAIMVDSESGQGTVFTVLFPDHRGKAEELDKAQAAAAPERWRGSGTVLLVDDEPSVREVGGKMLERLGFEVLTAKEGREAVELFRPRAAEIVCVVLDLSMPNMDGHETFEILCGIRSDVRVLIASGYSEDDVIGRFAEQQPAGVIQKPFQLAAFREKMKQIIGG